MLGKKIFVSSVVAFTLFGNPVAFAGCKDHLGKFRLRKHEFRVSIQFDRDGVREGGTLILAKVVSSSDMSFKPGSDIGVYLPEGQTIQIGPRFPTTELHNLVLVRNPKHANQLYFEMSDRQSQPKAEPVSELADNQFGIFPTTEERAASRFDEMNGHGNRFGLGDSNYVRGEGRPIRGERDRFSDQGHGNMNPDPDYGGNRGGQNDHGNIFDAGTSQF